MKKYLSAFVTLAIMGLLFYFSSQPGSVSTEVSGVVADSFQSSAVGRVLAPAWFSVLNPNANMRKWAHIYLYLAFGFSTALTARLWLQGPRAKRHPVLFPAGCAAPFCLLYAALDELHQYFVPGRAGLASDVLLDGFSAALGVLLAAGLWQAFARLRVRRKKR